MDLIYQFIACHAPLIFSPQYASKFSLSRILVCTISFHDIFFHFLPAADWRLAALSSRLRGSPFSIDFAAAMLPVSHARRDGPFFCFRY